MENKTYPRTFFSFSETRKKPVYPFVNNEVDTVGMFRVNRVLLNSIMDDTLKLFKKIEADRESN
jgi:hypothetical protein